MKKSSELVDQALRGFILKPGSLRQVEQGPDWYRDNRVGFKLRVPGTGRRVRENLQPALAPIGNSVQFSKPTEMVMVIGVHTQNSQKTGETMKKLIENVLKVNYDRSSKSGVKDVTSPEERTTLAALDAQDRRCV